MSPHYLVKCRIHLSDGRYIVSFQTLVALKRQVVFCGTGGCANSRLCCVATWMSVKQRHSKCSKWPPSAQIHASSLFLHWLIASPTTLYWNSARVSTSHFCNSCLSRIGAWYTRLCIMPQMQWTTGFGSGLLAGTFQDWWTGCLTAQKLDCVMSAMCWFIVLVEDKHVPSNVAYRWQQLLREPRVSVVMSVKVSKQLWSSCNVNFSQNFTYQKSLKSVNFWVIQK